MASADQQVHWTGPSPHVAFDGPLVHAPAGALGNPAGLGRQPPAFGEKPARRGNPIPIRGEWPGPAENGMAGDAPAVAGHVATVLRIDEGEIGPLRIREKP